jgi:hypothetical protein
MKYIQGENREQIQLFPISLEEAKLAYNKNSRRKNAQKNSN